MAGPPGVLEALVDALEARKESNRRQIEDGQRARMRKQLG